GIGCIMSDLPQENDLADIKQHGANHDCRTCNIEGQNSKADKEQLAVEYGLVKLGLLRILKWDQHTQTPQDAYHFLAEKAHTLLEVIFNVFNLNGENAFLKHWKDIEKPTNWYRMPNPLRHHQSFIFSD
ncbi:23006_t:CDS:2, partial [Cetraspora pellucida]